MNRPGFPYRALVAFVLMPWVVVACQPPLPEPPLWGGGYARLGCTGCHGPRGEGGPAAPALGGLGRHWEEERLLAYLRDPDTVKAGDPRLVALSGSYPLRMPPIKGVADGELLELVRDLLAN